MTATRGPADGAEDGAVMGQRLSFSRSSFSSMASRMKAVRWFFPAAASARANTSAGSRTTIEMVLMSFLSGGRPMREPVSDIGKSVKQSLLLTP